MIPVRLLFTINLFKPFDRDLFKPFLSYVTAFVRTGPIKIKVNVNAALIVYNLKKSYHCLRSTKKYCREQ